MKKKEIYPLSKCLEICIYKVQSLDVINLFLPILFNEFKKKINLNEDIHLSKLWPNTAHFFDLIYSLSAVT